MKNNITKKKTSIIAKIGIVFLVLIMIASFIVQLIYGV